MALAKYVAFIIFVAHWMACLFHVVTVFEGEDTVPCRWELDWSALGPQIAALGRSQTDSPAVAASADDTVPCQISCPALLTDRS